jgi:Disulphide bond corrector protein DsbC
MKLAFAALALVVLPLTAQSPSSLIDDKPHASNAKPAAVSYLFPEQVTVAADKPTAVDLHFKVAAGLHINSHTPREEELIPTTLKLPEASGVRLANATFPPGIDFSFPIDPSQKLSVYTGEFVIHTQLVAARGEHLVEGTLHYQACNNDTCMPPHSIPVAIDVIAK